VKLVPGNTYNKLRAEYTNNRTPLTQRKRRVLNIGSSGYTAGDLHFSF